jgi:hypothetical protein
MVLMETFRMIRLPLIALVALGVSSSPVLAAGGRVTDASASEPVRFDSETAAQDRCPNDTVVWLNVITGVYHHLSVRRYGRTYRGGYVCKSEADAAGDREAKGKDR